MWCLITQAEHMIAMVTISVVAIACMIMAALVICLAIWWHTSMTWQFSLRPTLIRASPRNRTLQLFRAFPKDLTAPRLTQL